jgi:BTB/POZ domain
MSEPGAASGMDVIRLNVSGKRIDVLRRTLTCLEGSVLEAKFSGRWDNSLEKDDDGVYFVNQPADLFMAMIDFLQCIENAAPGATPFPTVDDFGGNGNRFRRFADMVDFYGMTPLVLPPTIEVFGSRPDNVQIFGHVVDAPQQVSCILAKTGSRRIRSFEVTTSGVDSFQIGWCNHAMGKRSESVGQGLYSIGYDVTRCNVTSGEFNRVVSKQVSLPECTHGVIRCERRGSDLIWSINGESYVEHGESGKYDSYDPAFSGKGSWRLSKIEF